MDHKTVPIRNGAAIPARNGVVGGTRFLVLTTPDRAVLPLDRSRGLEFASAASHPETNHQRSIAGLATLDELAARFANCQLPPVLLDQINTVGAAPLTGEDRLVRLRFGGCGLPGRAR